MAVALFCLVFGVKQVGVGPTWRWQDGVGWKCVRHLWARVDSEKEGVFE
jgi:rhamnogalacturonyl hydrolase YesR